MMNYFYYIFIFFILMYYYLFQIMYILLNNCIHNKQGATIINLYLLSHSLAFPGSLFRPCATSPKSDRKNDEETYCKNLHSFNSVYIYAFLILISFADSMFRGIFRDKEATVRSRIRKMVSDEWCHFRRLRIIFISAKAI